MESNLKLYLDILQTHGITPTFPITAITLSKHPALIKKFSDVGVEFAVHSYTHIDYTNFPLDAFLQHIKKATETFEKHNIPFSGFRFPYLRWAKEYLDIIDNRVLKWDSSHTVLWDAFENIPLNKKNWRTYKMALGQYDYRNAKNYVALPRLHSNILEIPVSLPDDDLLFDRLSIKDEKTLSQIWDKILRQTYSRGELFTLQLHPERIIFFKETLRSLIRTANNSSPKIWVTSLGKIAQWWNEKQGFSIDINKKGNNGFEIHAHCSKGATILIKNQNYGNCNFFNDYTAVDKDTFTIRSSKRPVIGISNDCSPKLIKFLKNEGFVCEFGMDENSYSVYLNNFDIFNEAHETKVQGKIDQTNSPLVRFWRWPDRCRSALAITGDIDALTYADFFPRFFYR